MKPRIKISGVEIYALAFGLFLGLSILKFGNPVILDSRIPTPSSISDLMRDPWPTHWAICGILPLALGGLTISVSRRSCWLASKWLWRLPLLWFGWQLVSATQSVDGDLTSAALWQFFGCVSCYFLGAMVVGSECGLRWLLVGVLGAFAFCLVQAVDQRFLEFPQSKQMLIQGQQHGWTNIPQDLVLELKNENIIIATNGMDVANPAILAKFSKGRVYGTLVYPNALAGAVLLLFPISLVLALNGAGRLRPVIHVLLVGVTLFLGGYGFWGTGSKLGWLIAIGVFCVCLLRFNWPARLKWSLLVLVVSVGFGVFAVRFHNYFNSGAMSAAARLGYYRAAVQIVFSHPLLGTGPGTFQRPYAEIKSPAEEMARLAHNDYLEQFSDSGVPGGLFYSAWIACTLTVIGQSMRKTNRTMSFAISLGLLAWFLQGFGEFGLYIPAMAWTAFTLMGCQIYRMDK